MKPTHILLASVTATTLMTLFSQLVSEAEQENFNEAELLDDMVQNLHPSINKETSRAAGWIGHYAIGVAFATGYAVYLKEFHKKPNILNSVVAGAIGGAIGILGWHSMFKAHHNPPNTDLKKFYTQLMFAHVVFGTSTAGMIKLQEKAR